MILMLTCHFILNNAEKAYLFLWIIEWGKFGSGILPTDLSTALQIYKGDSLQSCLTDERYSLGKFHLSTVYEIKFIFKLICTVTVSIICHCYPFSLLVSLIWETVLLCNSSLLGQNLRLCSPSILELKAEDLIPWGSFLPCLVLFLSFTCPFT